MAATLLALATQVPQNALSQHTFAQCASKQLHLKEPQSRLLQKIADHSQIKTRHTVVQDFDTHGLQGSCFNYCTHFPTSAQRNAIFKKEALPLAESVCNKALLQWKGERESITHIISVSCTGMMAPGLEFLLIDRLGLSPYIERLGINFMGCFGAFKGLAIAKALALEHPSHRILLVCTELCSLHFQADEQRDTLVANSLFADGAAAVIIGQKANAAETPLFNIEHQASFAIENTTDLMTWEGGNHGYHMRLSALVPAQIEAHLPGFISRLTKHHQKKTPYAWAVHPGGKSILNAVCKACQLEATELQASWNILENYGNMSSPTFLFVLEELLKTKSPSEELIIGLGFGPGLSVEGILLKQEGSYVAR